MEPARPMGTASNGYGTGKAFDELKDCMLKDLDDRIALLQKRRNALSQLELGSRAV